MERLFASLRMTLWHCHHSSLKDYVYRAKEIAKKEVFRYIEMFYNLVRRHASLDYISPVQFEQAALMALLGQEDQTE